MTCSQQHRGKSRVHQQTTQWASCLADDKASASASSTHILLLENLPTVKMKQSQPSVFRETAENHTTAQSKQWEQSGFVQQDQEYYSTQLQNLIQLTAQSSDQPAFLERTCFFSVLDSGQAHSCPFRL